jgi:hypothetical protein
MDTVRFALAIVMIALGCGTAAAQGPLGTTPVDKKTTPPLYKPNEQLKNGVPSLFGQGGANTFHTPVGPAGAKANVCDAPAPGFARRPLSQTQQPSWWQRCKNFFGFGDPPALGTVPPQLPPGTAIGTVGGR